MSDNLETFFFLAKDSSKNRTKTRCIQVKTNSFVHFLEESSAWQFAFEISWPLEHVPQNNLNCQNITVLMMIKNPVWSNTFAMVLFIYFLLAGYGVRKRCLRKWRQNLPAARWLPLWMSCSLYWHEMHRGKCFRTIPKIDQFIYYKKAAMVTNCCLKLGKFVPISWYLEWLNRSARFSCLFRPWFFTEYSLLQVEFFRNNLI